jgi:hypothetical protein
MKISVSLIFILFFLSTQAQERSGVIIDQGTNKPIPYVTVKVLHSTRGQITTEKGAYRIIVNDDDTVFLSSIGYQDTVIAGARINNLIALRRKYEILQTVVFRSKNEIAMFIVGNGRDFIDKNIECHNSQVFDSKNNCLSWGPGGAAEFAEPIGLPDSLKTYRITRVYIPVTKHGCWQPIFFQIYEPDSISRKPGNVIFQKLVSSESGTYKKGKFILDLRDEFVYIGRMHHFYVSLSWDPSFFATDCISTLALFRSTGGTIYSRSIQSPNYEWLPFYMKSGNSQTMFAVELQELGD